MHIRIISLVIMVRGTENMATKSERHKENPFIEGMMIPIGTKSVRISRLGKDDNVLVNQHTGEVTGTHVVARKYVDKERFVKTYADYMAFTFELSKAGNKALRVVMWTMKEFSIGKDMCVLDSYTYEEFMEHHKDSEPPLTLSYPTFQRGLKELEKSKIIAKSMRVGHYFINPSCLFNGDRQVAFSTVLEQAMEEQGELPLEEEKNG